MFHLFRCRGGFRRCGGIRWRRGTFGNGRRFGRSFGARDRNRFLAQIWQPRRFTAAYGKNGIVRERQGNRTGQSSPIGTYRTADERYMVLSVSTDRIWKRMAEATGHPDWVTDPRYATNPERTSRADEVDAMVGGWFGEHTADEAQQILDDAGVPVSPIYSIADIFADAQYQARGDIISPADPTIGEVPMPGIVPRFSRTPGSVRFVGPSLGEHNQAVYSGLLGMTPEEMEALHAQGVI